MSEWKLVITHNKKRAKKRAWLEFVRESETGWVVPRHVERRELVVNVDEVDDERGRITLDVDPNALQLLVYWAQGQWAPKFSDLPDDAEDGYNKNTSHA